MLSRTIRGLGITLRMGDGLSIFSIDSRSISTAVLPISSVGCSIVDRGGEQKAQTGEPSKETIERSPGMASPTSFILLMKEIVTPASFATNRSMKQRTSGLEKI